MRCRHTIPFLLLTLSAISAFGQFGSPFPGQYPPGQNPQNRNPQTRNPNPNGGNNRRSQTTQEVQIPSEVVSGQLKRLSDTEAIIEAADKRIITVSLGRDTKFSNSSGAAAAQADFKPGDRVTTEATKDDHGFRHALSLRLDKAGTAEERAAALAGDPDASPLTGGKSGSTPGAPASGDGPPRLRRADAAPPATPGAAPKPIQAQIAPADPDASDEPVASNRPGTTVAPPPAAPDADDPGPPKLRRGVVRRDPAPTSFPPIPDEPQQVARASSAPPSARNQPDDDDSPRSLIPPMREQPAGSRSAQQAPQRPGDPIIEKAREAVFEFSQTLPNYVVKLNTTRYRTGTARGAKTSWDAIDIVTADVVYEDQKESYRNLKVNGKTPKEGIEQTGSWSTGEFASTQQDVLSPASDALFRNRRATTIVNRSAWRYDFSVEQENSHWHIYAPSESYIPGYSGAIWIDKETNRVLRIEMEATGMPKSFAFDSVQTAVDFDFVLMSGAKFLVPVRGENITCVRGTPDCSRNLIEFRNYRKYGSESDLTFGDEVPATPATTPTKPKR